MLVVFLGGWWLAWRTEIVNPLFISSPIEVVRALGVLLSTSETWSDIWATLMASILALVVGSVLGVLTGILFAASPAIRRGLNPYLALINGIPRPALAPIFTLWFGLGATPKVIVGASLVYFVLLLNTLAGMTSISADIITLARSLGMSRMQLFRLVQFPGSLPSIIAGLRLVAVYSFLGVVVSEIVASYTGLGQLLVQYTNQLDTAWPFVVVAIMSTMAVLLDTAVRLLQRRGRRGMTYRREWLRPPLQGHCVGCRMEAS
ncbi:ABC transporter permease [Blastococcus saxobsidens]|uniref:ABC transporter permease n=1 Tax=Blastococcus saxobsidens TaxID=138336 RepID=UPI000685B9B0|nr:ABC transporter permease [Blastococcus saxobsidens]